MSKINPFPEKKYKIIYADPPWQYQDKSLSRGGAECHYQTLSTYDISRLHVEDITDEDCVLFIWGTWTHNKEIHNIIESWGFTYKTVAFVWLKQCKKTDKDFFGMGNWTRANTEYCLLATKGKPKRINAGISQLIKSPIESHSKKPDQVKDKIVQLCGDVTRIELFARRHTEGWDVWGNDESIQEAMHE